MKIELNIPSQTLADLMTTAIEGGDPVTTASKGGWCWGIYWHSHKSMPPAGIWYADAKRYEASNFKIEVIIVDDENLFDRSPRTPDATIEANLKNGCFKSRVVTLADIATGLAKMAEIFPSDFGDVLAGNADAPCADLFLQAILFGKETYA